MLQGKWPVDSCQYCKKIEEASGFSDRMLHLTIPDMIPPELDADPIAVKVSPTVLEVLFKNTCNLSCLYCTPKLSSRINQENVIFGDFNVGGVSLIAEPKNNSYSILLDKFWTWMNKNSKTLCRFNILGGEPFYQEEFFKLIEYFEKTPHPNLEFGIVTNLMISENKLASILAKFKNLLAKRHLKRIDLTCSIDCWGIEQEYVRFGLDINTWERNFDLLLDCKWLTLNVNQTISVLTVKSMPELLDKLNTWRKQHPVGHYFSGVSPGPGYLMPHILGPDIFFKDFELIIKKMPTNTTQDLTAVSYMNGIKNFIEKSEPNIEEKRNLKIFLDENDRRRQLSWKQTFPWLVKELDNVV
jgi:organic radical activating enzyme